MSIKQLRKIKINKKQKMSKATIGTHSGTFHCDEALGCFLLQQTSQFAGAEIVRTRDPEVLKDLDIIIDVDDKTFNLDPQNIEAAINENTRAMTSINWGAIFRSLRDPDPYQSSLAENVCMAGRSESHKMNENPII